MILVKLSKCKRINNRIIKKIKQTIRQENLQIIRICKVQEIDLYKVFHLHLQ